MNNKAVKQARSETTQQNLMRAMEKLVADRGLENVTVRAIIEESGQKNESALQYHFKNRAGLLQAIHLQRMRQTQKIRGVLLKTLLSKNNNPSIRDICTVMVEPAFQLAKSDAGYRQYVKAFSQELATSNLKQLENINSPEGLPTLQAYKLLSQSLSHLGEKIFRLRMDSAVRFVSISMSVHARRKNSFQGTEAELFFNTLVDSMAGILIADVSKNTQKSLSATI